MPGGPVEGGEAAAVVVGCGPRCGRTCGASTRRCRTDPRAMAATVSSVARARRAAVDPHGRRSGPGDADLGGEAAQKWRSLMPPGGQHADAVVGAGSASIRPGPADGPAGAGSPHRPANWLWPPGGAGTSRASGRRLGHLDPWSSSTSASATSMPAVTRLRSTRRRRGPRSGRRRRRRRMLGERAAGAPSGSSPAAVEQPGGGQQERPAAHADDPARPRGEHRRRRRGPVGCRGEHADPPARPACRPSPSASCEIVGDLSQLSRTHRTPRRRRWRRRSPVGDRRRSSARARRRPRAVR